MTNPIPPSVDDTHPADDPNPVYRSRPRWFKAFVIIGVAVVVLMGAVLLAGGAPGGHGPGRHRGSAGEPASLPSGAEGHQPPAGGHR